MNRHGFSAIADAMMFIVLITVAVGIIGVQAGGGNGDPDPAEPSEVIDTVFAGKQRYSDLGITGSPGGVAPMNRIAYVSLGNGDGCFADLVQDALAHVYPWEGSYYLSISCSAGHDVRGTLSSDPWRTFTGTYQSGYGDDITVTVHVYR